MCVSQVRETLRTDDSELSDLEEPTSSVANPKSVRGTIVESSRPSVFTGDLDEDVEALEALEVRSVY